MARLAVYIIPDPESDLFRLGSAILGYDVSPNAIYPDLTRSNPLCRS